MSNPSLREALDAVLAEFRTELHTSFPARVLKYDAAAQTVDVRPALLREVPSEDRTTAWGWDKLPDLYAVPIMWPRAGGFAITFPIAVGDWVKVDCAEQSTAVWRDKGDAPSHPGLNDPHGLNGCIATPGWFPDKLKLADVDTQNLVLRSADNVVRITISDNAISLGSTTGDELVALSNKVDAEIARIWTLLSGGGTAPAKWVVAGTLADAGALQTAAAAIVGSPPLVPSQVQSTAATMVRAK